MANAAVFARAGLRALRRTITQPLPHPTWTRAEALAVHLIRESVLQVSGLPAAQQRSALDLPASRLPQGIHEEELELGGRPALQWSSEEAVPSRRILHFHGGGYVLGCPRESRAYGGELARLTGVPVLSLDYRLAPEHPHPAAQEDGLAAVRDLLKQGLEPEHLLLAGDSAGGGLALGALIRRRTAGEPSLAGAILGSPWLDLTQPGAPEEDGAPVDILTRGLLSAWASQVCPDPTDPGISSARADLSGLPALLFLVGELELLREDILACASACHTAAVPMEICLGEGAPHVWYTNPALPGPKDTIRQVAGFAREQLGLPLREVA